MSLGPQFPPPRWGGGDVGRIGIELESLILAQIERWRHALHMQVER